MASRRRRAALIEAEAEGLRECRGGAGGWEQARTRRATATERSQWNRMMDGAGGSFLDTPSMLTIREFFGMRG